MALTNDLGYTYELSLSSAKVSTSADVTKVQPGKVAILVTVTGDMTVRNTTAKREAPPLEAWFTPLWLKESEVCSMGFGPGFIHSVGSGDEYCKISWLYIPRADGNIDVGGTIRSGQSPQGSTAVENEVDLDRLTLKLQEPDAWAMGLKEVSVSGGMDATPSGYCPGSVDDLLIWKVSTAPCG